MSSTTVDPRGQRLPLRRSQTFELYKNIYKQLLLNCFAQLITLYGEYYWAPICDLYKCLQWANLDHIASKKISRMQYENRPV